MAEHLQPEKPTPANTASRGEESPPAAGGNPLRVNAQASGIADALGVPPPVSQLTPEEQMALFEKELKEKDWGHQPC